ncbi:hypothetical protein IPC838_32320, partial [Pseudomonas aeruginosa]
GCMLGDFGADFTFEAWPAVHQQGIHGVVSLAAHYSAGHASRELQRPFVGPVYMAGALEPV